jgi:MoaA/NifB/PqqE/SkfB family radical SAM enzyme
MVSKKDSMTLSRAVFQTVRYRVTDALGLRIRPRKLRFAVTKRCNARCAMCSAWKTRESRVSEITPDEIRAIAERNRRFLGRVSHVSITGGEPTLRRDLVGLVRAASESFPRAAFNINTNGFNTAAAMDAVTSILGFHRRLAVMISLDGLGEVHNAIRGVRGVFPHVVETIDRLVALHEGGKKLTVEVNFVLTNHNCDQLLPVYHFCRERGIAFNPIYPVYGQLYANEETEIGLERHAVRRFLNDLAEIQRADNSLALRELEHQLRGYPRDFDCWAGRTMFLIESDCRVFPNGGCPPAFCLGGLRDFQYSFSALLRSPHARGILSQLRRCRLCRIPCETLTTLRGPEALAGYRKMHAPRNVHSSVPVAAEPPLAEHPPRPRSRE